MKRTRRLQAGTVGAKRLQAGLDVTRWLQAGTEGARRLQDMMNEAQLLQATELPHLKVQVVRRGSRTKQRERVR